MSFCVWYDSMVINARKIEGHSLCIVQENKERGLNSMKKELKKWLAILVAGAMVLTLPLAVAADGPADEEPPAYEDNDYGYDDIPALPGDDEDVADDGADESADDGADESAYEEESNYPEGEDGDVEYDDAEVIACDVCGYDPCVCVVDFLPAEGAPENLEDLLDELQEIRDEVQSVFDAIFADPDQFPYADWDFVNELYSWFYWDWDTLDWLLEEAANPDNEFGITWDDVLEYINWLIGFWTYGYVGPLESALWPSIGDYCYGCDDEDCRLCFEQPGDEICPECGLPWDECEANDCLEPAVCDDCGQSALECDCFYCFVCKAELPEDCVCEKPCNCYCDCYGLEWDEECTAGCCICDEFPINDEPINDEPINDEPINDEPINDEPICDCGPFECCPKCCPICYPDEQEEEEKAPTPPASPQTGDAASAAPLVLSALMSISVFVGGTAYKKKKD